MQTRLFAVLTVLPLTAASFAETELVLVPVTVTDRKGATVTGLERQHFKLTQDNIPQSIVSFTRQDIPCSVSVIVDTSGMSVSSRPKIEAAFTQDPAEIQTRLRMVRPGGSTALVDTVYLALNKMHSAHNPRRALLVVSDGMDHHSRYSKGDLMRMAMEADVQIFC